jgi:transposase
MELKALRKHGWTISALAREFGLSRNTVRKELASDAPRGYPERDKPTELTPSQLAHVERRLAVYPTIRGTHLHYELQRHYDYAGSYRAFSRHLMSLRPPEAKDPEIRFETGPGIQTQADWAHLGLRPLGDLMAELHAMVAILGFSRAPAIRFAVDCTRTTSFHGCSSCPTRLQLPCQWCGGPIPAKPSLRRGRKWCSQRCCFAAYNNRKRAARQTAQQQGAA